MFMAMSITNVPVMIDVAAVIVFFLTVAVLLLALPVGVVVRLVPVLQLIADVLLVYVFRVWAS